MGKSRGIIIVVVLLFLTGANLIAQKNRYVVYFSDKAQSDYSIDQPEAFLSAVAIDRRTNQNIAIIEQDFPVNKNYLDSLIKYEVTPYFTSKWLNAVLVEATPMVIQNLASHSYVLSTEYVAPGQKLNGELDNDFTTPASSVPLNSSNLTSNTQLNMLSAQVMHGENITGKGVNVAVFDDGFLMANQSTIFSHVFENDRLLDVFDFTTGGKDVFKYDGHGTSSWSCMAASHGKAITGTGYEATFSLYVTEDYTSEYRIEEYNWLFAAERADSSGVDIISSSLGYNYFDDASMDYEYSDSDGNTSVISKAAKAATEKGMLVVSSAGNSGNEEIWPFINFPADVEFVLSVGAVDANKNRASFSSIGPTTDDRIKPEVVALGSSVTVLSGQNKLTLKSGTSFSAPLIAGFSAGIWQKFPTLTNLEIRDLIMASSDNHLNSNNQIGSGLPDYNVVVGNKPLSVSELFDNVFTIFPNPVLGDRINIRMEKDFSSSPVWFRLFSPEGKLITERLVKRVKRGANIDLKFQDTRSGIYILNIEAEGVSKNVKILRY